MSALKITIIMPIYNTPVEYLGECLSSVFAQTFTSFELICVDDASEDEMTKALINTYKNQHKNMQVIRLEHRSGAAIARNTGFSYAESEYVIFLDADDIFAEDFLMEMYQCAEESQADFCVCGHTNFHDRDRERERIVIKLDKEKVFDKNSDDWLMSIHPVPWNKLCRRDFLEKNNIYFQSLSSFNDNFYHFMCMICAKKFCVLERESLIFHRTGTMGQISANRDPFDAYKAIKLFIEVAPNCYAGDNLWNLAGYMLIVGVLYALSKDSDAKKSEELYLLVRKFFQEHPVSFKNRILQACKNNVLQLDYEHNWYGSERGFLWQLRLQSEEIKPLLARDCDIYVWGRGKRGDAFQQFCQEEGIVLSGIADIKDSNIGEVTKYGNKILGTREILEKRSGLIVASNRKIYEYLKEKAGCFLMNLEEFCPL